MVVSSGNGLTLVALAFVGLVIYRIDNGKRIDNEQSDGGVEPAVVHPVERLYRSPVRVDEHDHKTKTTRYVVKLGRSRC
ncbi:hypothetical protein [Rhodococcus sp. H29-C3]|uniref:hypothetical protein n=1 Tax=Rhodococcus sp. H29-C3 TaxID=3046307 RepID=UPI0024BA5687|nr:hypothetical protein [Rhodococcus sp. H29-C3]MDJ0361905.1 hypothetical protein [Rhodococcus sp. H29-C3]